MTILRHSYIFFILNSLHIIFLSSCSKYSPTNLESHHQATLTKTLQQKNVEISVQAFDEETFKDHFVYFQALSIHIKNKTDHTYILHAKNISLPLATPEEITKKAPALYVKYFLPTVAFSAFGYIFCWPIGIAATTVCSLWGYQKSWLQNKHGKSLLTKYMLTPTKPVIIAPFSSIDTLLLINKNDYKPEFTIQLDALNNNHIATFDIAIVSHSRRTYKTC